jgi:diguanylate cyclase (GGDEF)-like protein
MTEKEVTHEIEQRVYNEQVSLLYKGSFYRPSLHILSAAVFLLIVHKHVNPFYAYTWVLMLLGLNFYRFLDVYKTQKIIHQPLDFKLIHKRYALCAGLLGLIYGAGFVFFFNELPALSQVYLMTLIVMLIPAGLVSFVSDKYSFNLYFYSMAIPVIIRIIAEGQVEYFYMGLCGITFSLIVRKLYVWNHNVLEDAIRIKLENEQLLTALQGINSRLTELAVIDELTQIANRRSLDESLEREWLRAKRLRSPISLLMIDIDYFKQYNDEFGHVKGDECLVYIADFLKHNLNRSGDFVARYGGEEFCIIMPDTNMDGARRCAENIHSGVRDLKISNPGSVISKYVTISIGMASVLPGMNDTYMDLIYTSDKALYKAKNDGRNIIRTMDVLEKNPKPQLVV